MNLTWLANWFLTFALRLFMVWLFLVGAVLLTRGFAGFLIGAVFWLAVWRLFIWHRRIKLTNSPNNSPATTAAAR